MTPDRIAVTIAGLSAIAGVYWFFFMKKTRSVAVAGSVDIVVDGGYRPESIIIPKNTRTNIRFIRKDPSTCLEEVIIDKLGIRRYLPLNKPLSITVQPKKAGEYPFSCGMNMFHGKIIVE